MPSPAAAAGAAAEAAGPEQVEARRRALRQETVENHRLLRRLGNEDAELVAELAGLRDEEASLSADSADAGAAAGRA